MIVRTNIKCNTCDKATTLRVQLPNTNYEEIKFLCPHCKENLSIEVRLNQEKVTFKIDAKNNCIKTQEEGPLLYLGSEVITTNEMANNPIMSPAAFFAVQAHENNEIKYFIKEGNCKRWDLLFRAYNQMKLKNYALSDKLIGEYCSERRIKDDFTFKDCLYDHLSFTVGDRYFAKIEPVFINIGKQDKLKIRWLRNYIRKRYKELLPNVLTIINEIYQDYDLHFQYIISLRSGNDNADNLYFPQNDFASIKQTYGNIYEVFAELIEILACINNIQNKRDYDVFETMNLEKYKTIDKAKRSNCFNSNTELNIFCEEFDSVLRNASHHGHINYDKSVDKIIYYTNSIENSKSMSFQEYLLRINKLFMNFTSLFCIWLFVTNIPD